MRLADQLHICGCSAHRRRWLLPLSSRLSSGLSSSGAKPPGRLAPPGLRLRSCAVVLRPGLGGIRALRLSGAFLQDLALPRVVRQLPEGLLAAVLVQAWAATDCIAAAAAAIRLLRGVLRIGPCMHSPAAHHASEPQAAAAPKLFQIHMRSSMCIFFRTPRYCLQMKMWHCQLQRNASMIIQGILTIQASLHPLLRISSFLLLLCSPVEHLAR